MSESDNERRGVRWRMEADSDGWSWWTPHWDQRLATDSVLALAVEALRRGTDIRDACAESREGKGLTARALILMDVLNLLYGCVVTERAEALGVNMAAPHGTGTEIAQQLLEAGLLTPEEYRPSD
jgi:hypothetical protein